MGWCARVIATGASLLQGDALHFVGAPPSGRLLGVCEGDRDEGVAPTGGSLHFVGAPPSGRICSIGAHTVNTAPAR